jgi:hypothetical protein
MALPRYVLTALLCFACVEGSANAQSVYPSRNINVVVASVSAPKPTFRISPSTSELGGRKGGALATRFILFALRSGADGSLRFRGKVCAISRLTIGGVSLTWSGLGALARNL